MTEATARILQLAGDRFAEIEPESSDGELTVLVAFDRTLGERVRLHLIDVSSGQVLRELKARFRSLCQVEHDSVARLYELFSDGTTVLFTEEYVDGTPLSSAARHVDERERLSTWLARLAGAISAIHRQGEVCRELKHDQILITGDNRVKLRLPVGASRDAAKTIRTTATTTRSGHRLIAPEIVSGSGVTFATDWYAFGCLLDDLAGDGGEELAALSGRLLAPRPEDRPSGQQVLRELGDETSHRSGEAASSRQPFVGRDAEVFRVEDWLWKLRSRGPRVAVLRGPAGIGKTELARHVAARVEERGGLVLRSRCHPEVSVPQNAWDEIVDSIATLLEPLDDGARTSLLTNELTELFPALRFGPHGSNTPVQTANPAERWSGAVAALTRVLGHLLEEREVLLVLDDLHHADADSVRLFREMTAHPAAPAIKYLVTARADELALSPLARLVDDPAWQRMIQVIDLEPLSNEAVWEYLAALPESLGKEAETVVLEAGGNPFLLVELARETLETSRAAGQRERELPRLIQRRLEMLSASARRLFETMVLFRRPLPLDVAARALGLEARGATDARRLGLARLARVRRTADTVFIEPYHDRLAEGAFEHIAPEDGRTYLRALGESLLEEPEVDHAAVAFCLAQSEESLEAAKQAELAARAAEKTLAFSRAVRWLTRALEWGKPSDDERLALLSRLGEAAQAAGDATAATSAFSSAARLVNGNDVSTRARKNEFTRRSAHCMLMAGRVQEANESIRPILEGAGYSLPERTAEVLTSFSVARLGLRARALRWVKAPATAEDVEHLRALETASVAFMHQDPIRAWLFATWHLRAALRFDVPDQLLSAIGGEMIFSALDAPGRTGWLARLLDLADEVKPLTTNPLALARFGYGKTTVALLHAEWREAEESGRATEKLLLEHGPGAYLELEGLRRIAIGARQLRGGLRQNEDDQARWLAQAEERCDKDGIATHLASMGYAHCSRDDPGLALASVARIRQLIDAPKNTLLLNALWLEAFTLNYIDADVPELMRCREALERSLGGSAKPVRFYRAWSLGYEARLTSSLAFKTQGRERKNWTQRLGRIIPRLLSEEFDFCRAQADQVRAALALLDGDRATTVDLLFGVAKRSDACDMKLFALSAEYIASKMAKDRRGVERVGFLLRELGVENVERMALTHVPFRE